MSGRENLDRGLRSFWATLAVLLLLGGGGAYGMTRYTQMNLEDDATRDARKLATEVLLPMLTPGDVQSPVRGPRYDELLAEVRDGVLAGPINGLKLWRNDGTILFADEPDLVGKRDPDMRDLLHDAISGAAQSEVDGDRYRTLVSLRVGETSPSVVTAELDQSHAAIVERSRERWYPWAIRAGAAAAVCVGLYIATALFFGVLGILARRAQLHRKQTAETALRPAARPRSAPSADPNLPAYMQPGFRQQVEARRAAEEALVSSDQNRQELLERLARVQAELEETRRETGQEPSDHPAP